ncbi:dihydroxyacetone kinase phosphoryl donor subunit DhaM [Suttonella ornithocola]|uniref:phosphoenolpyruvate--glycerone phosphotransferase n=1 Tax=Suttonella ornithocola TaxID=279832 RepID=A0A380N0V8_9GAMM|nr:dihydroxyacetone kinase phosphoryl donor subunit DhaM [Suttonella ornithocola]SUO97753.1 PTS-dependent dihydroxyacetone kinase, phosphotransferase subunit dhaM [Suttonella ornithocola]
MVNLLLVSHSRQLAESVRELALQMAPEAHISVAAGIDDPDNPIGTDAVAVMEAIETNAQTEDGIVILVDLGSAILSTQTALALVSPELAEKVTISPAPFVEGTIAAAVSAISGANREQILTESLSVLRAKESALGTSADAHHAISDNTANAKHKLTITVENKQGIHARPAAKIAAKLSKFSSDLTLTNHRSEESANPKTLGGITQLNIQCGDMLTLSAEGTDAQDALETFQKMAKEHFGDKA